RAKALAPRPPSVLVTTAVPERVPDALAAGCDGVLLKPFVPNLLYARIGRLLRQRARALREAADWPRTNSVFAIEHAHPATSGTNVVRSDAQCPSCGRKGAVSFDAASRRRLWYACVPCRHVWLGAAGRGLNASMFLLRVHPPGSGPKSSSAEKVAFPVESREISPAAELIHTVSVA